MRKVFLTLLLFLLTTIIFAKDDLQIGIVLDGDTQNINQVVNLIKYEVETLMDDEYNVIWSDQNILSGNWDQNVIKDNLDKLLKRRDIDIVVALGVLAGDLAIKGKEYNKPVFAPLILDQEFQKIRIKQQTSGIKNLNYLVALPKISECLATYQEFTKDKEIPILIDQYLINDAETTELYKIPELDEYNFRFIKGSDSADEYIKQIGNSKSLYFSYLPRLNDIEYQKLIDYCVSNKIVTFSHLGIKWVRMGMLAAIAAENDFRKISKRLAIYIQAVMSGEKAEDLSIHMPNLDAQVVINMETARKIEVFPSYNLLMEATLLNEFSYDTDRILTFSNVVDEALKENLEILEKIEDVNSRNTEKWSAMTNFLPQVNSTLNHITIDSDRAKLSGGQNPEHTLKAGLTISQMLFNEQIFTAFSAQKQYVELNNEELNQLKADITNQALQAVLTVLKATNVEKIYKSNIRLTRTNLRLARIRRDVGVARASEVLRWEAELASNRDDVLSSENNRKQAEMNLNRILNRPLEEKFIIDEKHLDSRKNLFGSESFTSKIENPLIFNHFRDFLVKVGLQNSPELNQLNLNLEMQEKLLTSMKRKFYLPTAGLSFDYSNELARNGKGDNEISEIDDSNWSLVLNAQLPLFSGSSRMADVKKQKLMIKSLRYQIKDTEGKLEQNIRNMVYQAGNTYAKINAAQQSHKAASQSLELTIDDYQVGSASYSDLLDNQTKALITEVNLSNSMFNFLSDYFAVRRAVYLMDFTGSIEDQAEFYKQFEQFLNQTSSK